MIETIAWPPKYTLKRHARARHVKLKASPQKGLEIVVPKRFNPKQIPDILENNKLWIEKRLLEIQNCLKADAQALPDVIELHAINQVWKIQYIKADNKKLKLIQRPQQQELVLLGDILNKEICVEMLISWIKKQATLFLTEHLNRVSTQTQLSYKKIMIRAQKTRWGSCTSEKTISLNYKLILMPFALVTHILIHELCHTVHLNHSAKFWRLVASFDSMWKEHSREIRRSEKWLPMWIQ